MLVQCRKWKCLTSRKIVDDDDYKEVRYEAKIQVNPTTPHFPEDLLTSEIFLKLPTKSLVRFKSLSKACKSIISSPKFVELHLQQLYSKHQNHGAVLQQIKGRSRSVKLVNCQLTNHQPTKYDMEFDFEELTDESSKYDYLPSSKYEYDPHTDLDLRWLPIPCLLDSCNGLLCFQITRTGRFCALNPITQECQFFRGPMGMCPYKSSWGFGFISSLDDYKLVIILNPYRGWNGMSDVNNHLHVYSMKSGKWREIDASLLLGKHDEIGNGPGIFLANGTCHWTASNKYDESVFILALDLVTESSIVIPLPNGSYKYKRPSIGLIGQDLCIGFLQTNHGFNVSVLNCYGEWGSWETFYKFKGDVGNAVKEGNIDYYSSCMVGKDGNFFMHWGEKVWLLCWRNGRPLYVRVKECYKHGTRPYVESLVSPFMMDEERF